MQQLGLQVNSSSPVNSYPIPSQLIPMSEPSALLRIRVSVSVLRLLLLNKLPVGTAVLELTWVQIDLVRVSIVYELTGNLVCISCCKNYDVQ